MTAPPPTIAAVQAAVAEAFRLPLAAMKGEVRDRDRAWPRQAGMALAFKITGRSSTVIGRAFGGRDHTTVLYAVRAVAERRARDPDLDAKLRRVERQLTCADQTRRADYQPSFLHGPLFDLAGARSC